MKEGRRHELVSWLHRRFDSMSLAYKIGAWVSFQLAAVKGLLLIVAWIR
jgi:hypothetical protein